MEMSSPPRVERPDAADVPQMASDGGSPAPHTVNVCQDIVVRRMSPDHLPELAGGYLKTQCIRASPDRIEVIAEECPGGGPGPQTCIDRDTIFAAVWKETGGTVLFDSGDIGRHSSVDRVIGMAPPAGIDPGRTFIACSGRMRHEGIPVMVSSSAPSASAREGQITPVGVVRPPRMTVYTGDRAGRV